MIPCGPFVHMKQTPGRFQPSCRDYGTSGIFSHYSVSMSDVISKGLVATMLHAKVHYPSNSLLSFDCLHLFGSSQRRDDGWQLEEEADPDSCPIYGNWQLSLVVIGASLSGAWLLPEMLSFNLLALIPGENWTGLVAQLSSSCSWTGWIVPVASMDSTGRDSEGIHLFITCTTHAASLFQVITEVLPKECSSDVSE